MKKILFILVIATIAMSCEKENEGQNLCPVVAQEAVPTNVMNAFHEKYPDATVQTWFNKDSKGFCAVIKVDGKEVKAYFDNNGKFQNEENDDRTEDGCKCEVENIEDEMLPFHLLNKNPAAPI